MIMGALCLQGVKLDSETIPSFRDRLAGDLIGANTDGVSLGLFVPGFKLAKLNK